MYRREWVSAIWKYISRQGDYPLTQAVFLRMLGLVYLVAFTSLRPQVVALFGSHGITPIVELLQEARMEFGTTAYHAIPTIFWLGVPDRWLEGVCFLGCAAAILMLAGFLSRTAALVCWILYLSLVSAGAPFMNFQWDALLLESGFLALFAGAPWLPLAFRLLLFRLMFESGLMKLTSGDANWRDLHALRFHFLTQPLPTPLAWYAYHLPGRVLNALTAVTLAIELAVPFGLFGPRRVRQAATLVLMTLQLAIILTGNYGFFNLLTLTLCLWGLDDQKFAPIARYLRVRKTFSVRWFDVRWTRVAGNTVVVTLMTLGVTQVFHLNSPITRSATLRSIEKLIAPFEIVNTYGLFAVMTTVRSEIVLQGSNDGEHWTDYEFRYKPGNLHRSLPVVAPRMPRLDWQMWFAALGTFNENRWVGALMYRLLVGDRTVTDLLLPFPFPRVPRYLRAELYDYTFTSRAERERNGAVWKRELRGDWFGPVSLTGR